MTILRWMKIISFHTLSNSLHRDKCEVLSVSVYLAQTHWSLLCLQFAIFHDIQVAFHDIQVAIYRYPGCDLSIFRLRFIDIQVAIYRDKFLALSRPPTVVKWNSS